MSFIYRTIRTYLKNVVLLFPIFYFNFAYQPTKSATLRANCLPKPTTGTRTIPALGQVFSGK